MKKIILIILLLLPIQVIALTYPSLHYQNAILYDLTDEKVLYELNSDEVSSVASLTKIMTTLVAIDNIETLDEKVTYDSSMADLVRWDASVAGLKVGDQVTYRDLLYASILPSGADATTALAITTSGSISSFVQKMNETAAKIGMTNTHFANVTGLDAEGHHSTARDILILLKYAFQNPLFKEIYTTKTYTLSNNLTVKSTISSNRLNKDTSRILGSKTGYTNDAGRCISAYFTSSDHEFLLVTLKAPSDNHYYHISDALELITFIDNNYHHQNIITKDQFIKRIPVKNSKTDSYTIISHDNITKYLPDDYDKSLIKIEYTGLEELSYKTKENTKIGELKYYYDDTQLSTKEVYLEKSLEIDIIKVLLAHKLIVFTCIIVIAFIILSIIKTKKILKQKSKI